MKYFAVFCVFLALPFVNQGILIDNTQNDPYSTPAIIARHGYPVEVHTVKTTDDYILTMHRIPCSPKTHNDGCKPLPVFIMHGLLDASSGFALPGRGKGLPYLLSEAGYDVWLGNARGNKYSKNHATKNPISKSFWDFTWHEIGMKDLPAMIDYVLHWVGAEKLHYFGHSQGTTSFFVMTSSNPTYNSKIEDAFLLAPVAFMEHAESPVIKLSAALLGQPNGLVELLGSAEFLPDSKLLDLFGRLACSEQLILQDICGNILFLLAGWDSPYLNETMLPEIFATVPAGASVNQIMHYSQLKRSGEFQQFDYGRLRNLIEYKQLTPPKYPLDKISASINLYYSDNDALAAVPDVEKLISLLPKSTVKRAYRIPHPKFNHMDFLWGMGVEDILYSEIMADLESS